MNPRKKLNHVRMRRARRTKAKIFGTATMPRLAVYRSNRSIAVQLIDDRAGRTLVAASNKVVPKATGKTTKSMVAFSVGELAGKRAIEKGIKKAVFDRRSYKFHGRVKNVAEGAKKAGLKI